jgi:hypothetical protein
MAARAAMMPFHDPPMRDPSIRLQRTPSQRSKVTTSTLKDDSAALSAGHESTDLNALSSRPAATSPLAEAFELSRSASRGPMQDDYADMSTSGGSQYADTNLHRTPSSVSLSRGNTLKKQKSLSRRSSLRRSSSRRSVRAGNIGGITYDDTSGVDFRSVYYSPVPTSGSPTEVLANRFQGEEIQIDT